MRKKISARANRFLHAQNRRNLISRNDLEHSSTKEIKFIEGGFNGIPYIKAGIKIEKIIEPKKP